MPSTVIPRPGDGEFAAFYAPYLAAVPDGDLPALLRAQEAQVERALRGLPEARALHRYADGKWSVKEIVGHLSDAERVFAYRALRIGRGDTTPLPGFDENRYVDAARSDSRRLDDLLDEFAALRCATLLLFAGIDAAGWSTIGSANGHPISARALAWITAGHVAHHLRILTERYGLPGVG